MKSKEKKIILGLFLAQIYCLPLSWLNGGEKVSQPLPYFFNFLTWWCVWNCLLTLGFIFWKAAKKPSEKLYSTQLFSLILMISNLVTFLIFALGLIIWGTTALTTHWGITQKIVKLVPIPSHTGSKLVISKIIHWWAYAPLWHLVAPIIFIYWFFRYVPKNLLKKKLKLTLLFCLFQPVLYFAYCWLRSKLSPSHWLKEPFSRWPYPFLSAKIMAQKWNIDRWVYKLILVLFWFILFGLMVYFSLRYAKKIKVRLLINKNKNKNKVSKNWE
ncbi:MAG: hypothetical protein MRERC_1c117 [Mycoplasmataceae bacterium RC_NB112A]|nr:MAG: hypothetical protein MRERC_1c117 [Mycoplasmataceae bacterium RC_NB112A]